MKYKLRPSGSSRWLACPASLVLGATIETEKRNDMIAAYTGTAAHEILERCVKGQHRADKYLETTVEVFDEEQQEFPYTALVDEKMVAAVNFFLDEVGEPDSVTRGTVYSEVEMQHSEIPELKGTADYLRIDEVEKHGMLCDLKNGTSIVQVKNKKGEINTQLMSYACLVFDLFEDLETLTLAIIQPNGSTKLKTRSTGINRKDASLHLDRVREAARLADEATEATLNVITSEGSWCWYCPARQICPSRGKASVDKDFG